jgi:hypothetical protein
MESERCDTGVFPLLDLPADLLPLIVQCFKGSDGAVASSALCTLASTSTALLQIVLEAGTRSETFRAVPELGSSLSQICFSDRSNRATTAVVRGKFLLTPDASTWVVWMTLEAMAQMCAAHAVRASAAAYSSADQNSCKGTDRAAADLGPTHVPAHTSQIERSSSNPSVEQHKPCSSESTSCATQPASFFPPEVLGSGPKSCCALRLGLLLCQPRLVVLPEGRLPCVHRCRRD